ncbi:MAG TPA: MEDS domain-containing protein [Candidatus Limnocylindria bacterium]|nr:MEDS domain-containing protein [Candidatus Limnocylindria bacterium]
MDVGSPFERKPSSGTLDRGGHGVELYAYDAQIVDKVARFVAPALEGGSEVAVVIATDKHRRELESELSSRGIDVSGAIRESRYVALDAATTLSKFLVDGQPDPERFAEVIGGAIAKAQTDCKCQHVRAYGEMVALLWLAGRPDAAIAVEKMWNDLARTHSFTLLCGYPISAFDPSQAAEIAEVGKTHSQVAPIHAFGRPIPA